MAIKTDNMVVYIIDDDESVRKGMMRLMRSYGITSYAFDGAYRFLEEFFNNESNACILFDINMPRLSGLQMGLRLKEQGSEIPMIAISARDDEETRRQARNMGALFFLSKPVDDHALIDAILWVMQQSNELPKI